MKSWILTWENSTGQKFSNQVTAPDRDSAIFRLALLMQTPYPDTAKFVSCELEGRPDVRPHEGKRGWWDVTCGNCGEEFGTNFVEDQIDCPECEARRCPECHTWFGADQ